MHLDCVGLLLNLYDATFPEKEPSMASSPASTTTTGVTILRLTQVITRTGLSKSNIYERLNPKSPRYDPTFPERIKLGTSAVGWFESEIEAWLISRASADGTLAPREIPAPVVKESSSPVGLKIQGVSKTDQELFGMRVATVRQFLEKRAKAAMLVRYSELMERTMLSGDSPNDWVILDTILSDISRASYAENNVLLAAHVRKSNDPSDFPRESFFDLANELELPCDNKNNFLEKQIRALFGHYSNPQFRTDKRLYWMDVAGKCMAFRPA